MKIVMSPRVTPQQAKDETAFVDELRERFPNVTFEMAIEIEDQKQAIKDADVYYGWPTRDVFLQASKLNWIQCPGTGIDDLTNISELVDSDVVVTNCRGPHAPPMADHVMGMIINLAHLWKDLFEDQRTHRWEMRKYQNRQVELSGSTLGILSLGDIGTQIAKRARGFGMKVYAVDKYPESTRKDVDGVWGLDKLDDLIAMSDWFVVAAPYTKDTKNMIDRRRMALMKNGSYLIVISRGGIIDEKALLDELKSGRLAGAGLDVFEEEPLSTNSPFWDMENVVITPHASALTPNMNEKRKGIFVENLKRFLSNKPFLYVCDKRSGF